MFWSTSTQATVCYSKSRPSWPCGEKYSKLFLLSRHSNSVELGVKEDALELLVQGQWFVIFPCLLRFMLYVGTTFEFSSFLVVSGLAASLPTLLISTSTSAAERKDQLNAVKMSVYLLCKLTEAFESDSYRQNIITAPGKVNF